MRTWKTHRQRTTEETETAAFGKLAMETLHAGDRSLLWKSQFQHLWHTNQCTLVQTCQSQTWFVPFFSSQKSSELINVCDKSEAVSRSHRNPQLSDPILKYPPKKIRRQRREVLLLKHLQTPPWLRVLLNHQLMISAAEAPWTWKHKSWKGALYRTNNLLIFQNKVPTVWLLKYPTCFQIHNFIQ